MIMAPVTNWCQRSWGPPRSQSPIGDIHGHQRNFERIVDFADLENNPDTHVILQEIIHGGPTDAKGGCLSYKLLFEVVRYKIKFPDRVHIIMGNHDTTLVNNTEVMKDGKEMNRSMRKAIESQFNHAADDIINAMCRYMLSQPLAVRCENRIWFSHSLPADLNADEFDESILTGPLQKDDLIRPGSAYLLTWGRNHSQSLLDKMAELLDVDFFVLGHQPQKNGWSQAGQNLIIIASNHNHGTCLAIDLTKSYTIKQLVESLIPLASIA